MADCAFGSVGAEKYQVWFDTLDLKKPLPKLVPPPPNFTLRRITQSYKIRTNDVQHSRQTLINSARTARHIGPTAHDAGVPNRDLPAHMVPSEMAALHALVKSNDEAFNLLVYLVLYGSSHHREELAPEALTQETNAAIMAIFAAIDTDGDSRIEVAELVAAAKTIGLEYDVASFKKIDKARTGFADLMAILRAFFPQYSMKRIVAMQQRLAKPKAREPTTAELLSPSDLKEIEETYKLYSGKPGGCTLANMLSVLSNYHREHTEIVINLFRQFDTDGDGVLTLSEFVEMVKHNYPPFKQRETFMERLPPVDIRKFESPLNRDRRVFETQLLHRSQPLKPFGAAEMLVVAARRAHGEKMQTLNRNADLLHVTDTVRHFAALRAHEVVEE